MNNNGQVDKLHAPYPRDANAVAKHTEPKRSDFLTAQIGKVANFPVPFRMLISTKRIKGSRRIPVEVVKKFLRGSFPLFEKGHGNRLPDSGILALLFG